MNETPLQKAERIALGGKPCTIVFRNGKEMPCEKITDSSVTLVGHNNGTITVLVNGKKERVIVDWVKDIKEHEEEVAFTVPILSAKLIDGEVAILADIKYAKSIHAFLHAKGVVCSQLTDAIFQPAKTEEVRGGRIVPEKECTVQGFEADCTIEEFRKLIDEWCLATLGCKAMQR